MDQKAAPPRSEILPKTTTLAFHTNKPKLLIEVESRKGILTFLEARMLIAYTPSPAQPQARPTKIRDVQALPQGELVEEKVWELRQAKPIAAIPNVRFLELVFQGLDYTKRVRKLERDKSSQVTRLYRAILSQAELRFVVQIGDSEVGVFDIALANRIIEVPDSSPPMCD